MAHPSAALLGALAAAGLLLPGCLDVSGCYGTATWTEPGLSAWLEGDATAAADGGFRRIDEVPGLDPGLLAARLPEGAHLQWALYSERGGMGRDVSLSTAGVNVGAFTMRHGADAPDAESMVALLARVLDQVHAGNATDRAAALDELRASWPADEDGGGRGEGHLWWSNVSLHGPWALHRAVPEDAPFVASGEGGFVLEAGGWHLVAATPRWIASWPLFPDDPSRDVHHRMEVDEKDGVTFDVEHQDTGKDVQAILGRDPRGVDWTFQGFDYETTCVPGPIF